MYRLLGRLEASELSELYRAERSDGTSVVIKLFHPKTTDLAYAKVIADSSQRLGAITTPGIARVLQVGSLDHRLAIVREDLGKYTLGQALTRLNTREVVLPPAVAIAFVIEVAETLEAAHRAQVVHGALTPGNVLLGADGRSAVADFGALAALMASPALRKAFGSRGRSSYRAPELKSSGDATPASDVYALGAMAYELLTLKEASVGRDSLSTRQAEKLPPPSRLVRRLHSRIDPIIMRALEQSSGRRQRSAGELAESLREFLSAQGGVPGRDDVRKFVEELFPKDVVVNALGPVPFQKEFELDDIAGVSDLVAELPEVSDRAPFSGGAIDDRTSTSDGLPVFGGGDEVVTHSGAQTQQEVPAASDTLPPPRITWDAPVGAMPAVAKDSDGADEVSRRVKAIEDFAPKDTLPPTPVEKTSGSAQGLKPVGPRPKENTERQKLKTIVTFAVPFKRDTDYVPPDWRKEREARKRAGVTAVRLGAAILTFFTLGIVGLWLMRTPDAIGDLISWMPTPIEVALNKLRNPNGVGPPGPPLALPSNLKLPDFDKPPKHTPVKPKDPEPDPTPPKKIDPPKPLKNVTPPPPKGDCYAPPPNGPQATLTVELARAARVELDGVRVCGVVNKLPVSPGKHLLRIVDGKSKQEWKSTMQFEAGKQKKVAPNFR
ncbi:MAG: serine/threonine protein kinase [Archangiaceae bacterium]|nr:serine/threonine protein kinase [Archangiaceae bacterium]